MRHVQDAGGRREQSASVMASAAGTLDFLNPGARVVCLLCGLPAAPDDLFRGCQACGVAAPLTVVYPHVRQNDLDLRAAVKRASSEFALFAPGSEDPAGRPSTPLDSAPRLGSSLFLKQEAFSLTGSHKDRYQATAARSAVLLGCRGIVASSTGNHGVSAAAHAAAAGLPAVVFCHRDAPVGLLRAIAAFGGIAAQVDADEQREALVALVADGWFPATSIDPTLTGAANPFAAEGYRAVAYETVEQLGALPDVFIVPTAGGDTYYGIAKGFAEIAGLSGHAMPTVIAVQPQGANSLSRSLAAGRQVTVDDPASIALSIADDRTGRHVMAAMSRWHGSVLDVSEKAIRAAIVDLAGLGIYADPASAAALAGYRLADATGAIPPDASSVLLLTSSGFKWPDAMAQVFPADPVQSRDALRRRLAAL